MSHLLYNEKMFEKFIDVIAKHSKNKGEDT